MLVYVTGGVAFGGMDYDATIKTGNTSVHLSDDIRVGYVLGAGVEFALRSNWSLKLEYQYLNFGDHGATGALTSIFNNYCAPPTVTDHRGLDQFRYRHSHGTDRTELPVPCAAEA